MGLWTGILSGGAEHLGATISEAGDYRGIDCESCGWAHLSPIPVEAELALLYERSYYQDLYPGWLDKDRAEKNYWDLEHADKLADWSELLGKTRSRLLDVGCSGGLLMEFAIAQGWEAEGIEPSDEAVDEARSNGLLIHAGVYEDVILPASSFDVVHSKLFMEHLPNPRQFFDWAARVLPIGGLASKSR